MQSTDYIDSVIRSGPNTGAVVEVEAAAAALKRTKRRNLQDDTSRNRARSTGNKNKVSQSAMFRYSRLGQCIRPVMVDEPNEYPTNSWLV